MDYSHQPLNFKLRKAARYVRLYGPRRTAVKIRSQYHMQKRYRHLPLPKPAGNRRQHVGIVGCGKFAFAQVAYYLTRHYGPVIRGVMDVDINHAASLGTRYGAAYHTAEANRVLADPAIDLVFIASNHASHAEYAVEALRRGKHVHIEKPHVVSGDQLDRLCDAMRDSDAHVRLGFNRPDSRIGRHIRNALAEEDGAAMMSWFVAGHAIEPDHWYFRPEEGGRVLGNLCHWTDFLYQSVAPQDRYPIEVTPTRAELSDCDVAVTYTFGDGSIGAITFSAKGHTFEGVKERFAAHKGDTLITMDDFQTLTVERSDDKHRVHQRVRDHGHEATILGSYEMSRPSATEGPRVADRAYVWETGQLFLKTKEALEQNRPLSLKQFAPATGAEAL